MRACTHIYACAHTQARKDTHVFPGLLSTLFPCSVLEPPRCTLTTMGSRICQDLHELKPSPPAGEQAETPTVPAPAPSPGTPAPSLLTPETLFPPLSLRMLTRWKGIPRGLYSSCESVYTAPPQLLRAPCRQTGAPAFKDPPEQVGQLSVTGAAAKPPGSPAGPAGPSPWLTWDFGLLHGYLFTSPSPGLRHP